MKQLSSLIILINTLSKAEKRNFRMTANLQTGDKKYLWLCDLIEAGHPVEEIHERFCAKYPCGSFEMAVKHLYRSLMDCLVNLRRKRDVQTKMFATLSEADILFERALYDEAFEALDRVKKVSTMYELDALTLMARRNELKYLNILDFRSINERQLIGKQMKIVEIIKSIRSSYFHSQLYDILKLRLFHEGYVHSEKQKKDLDDLVLSELNIIANYSKKSFETQKLHLLFQSAYYLDSGNYKMAVRFYRTLIELFEANRHLILNPPVYYLQAITGILNSLKTAGLYEEMPFFINKLKEIAQGEYAVDFILNVHAYIFLYQFAGLFNTGNFTGAATLISEQEETLFKNLLFLQLDMQLDLLLTLVRLHISTGNYAEARKNMKKITASGKMFYTLPAYHYARLLNLILQTELKNYDFSENEIKSIKRSINYEKQMYMTEKLLFKFIQRHHLLDRQKIREQLLKQIRSERPKIMKNKYERQLLCFFDFISWMEKNILYYQ
ncbi:MAG: hypothetical protein LBH32_03810 [Dysgonamonadaceae bacterium]|jgi:hypothetical protein|nr:hypothetical protein [Dysgonamonadaceae bacterium]